MDNNQEYIPEIVTVVDDENNEIELELIGGLVDDGVQYYALIPADEDGGEDAVIEYLIMKVAGTTEEGEDLVIVDEDDPEFERIAARFDEWFDVDYDSDAN